MFSANIDDLQFLFDSAGQSVLINDNQRQAIITNPPVSDNEERLIHTLENVQMGDIVEVDDEQYLCIIESISKRHGKFKSKIRHCNHTIQLAGEEVCTVVGENSFGEEIIECVQGEPIFIPAIVDYKSFTINGGAILVAENQIFVTIQDNEVNRAKFAVNNTFNLMDLEWKVRNVDKTKKGLLLLTCEREI